MPRERILSSPAYWFEKAQNELFRQFHYYMEEEKINQTQLAERLGITKGRVSQILRGESNFTMKTLIELSLSIRKIAKISYVSIENEVELDELKRLNRHNFNTSVLEKKTPITSKAVYYKGDVTMAMIPQHGTTFGDAYPMKFTKNESVPVPEPLEQDLQLA